MSTSTTPPSFCPAPQIIFSLPIPTIPYIPNSLKSDVHALMFQLLRIFNRAHSENRRIFALSCFFAIPKLALRKNGKHEPRNRNRRSVHALIRTRIDLALRGQWSPLYEEAIEAFGLSQHNHQFATDPIHRCKKAIQSGAVGKAAQALLATENPVPTTPQNAAILKELHPKPKQPVVPLPRGSLPPAYSFTEAEVRREIRSFQYHSSPGADGLRPSHLKIIPHAPGGEEPSRSTLTEFTTLCNKIASADLPSSLSPYIAGGRLLGLPKPDPTSLRPIAIGLVVRRLVGRLLMMAVLRDTATDIRGYLLPYQLGVGTKGGTEAIIHATRNILQDSDREDVAVLLVDAKNAFNSIERAIILEQTILKAPGLARWVHYAYGKPSILLFGGFTIFSMTGTQQGDPLSMLLFALALQPVILDLVKHFPFIPLKAFYADNGTLIMKPSEVIAVLAFLLTRGAQSGFIINLIKTKLWFPFHPNHVPPGFNLSPCTIVADNAVTILGAPFGTPTASHQIVMSRVDAVKLLWERLEQLHDPQIAYHILRQCASACRLIYLLRTTPPQKTKSAANTFDYGMRRVFERTHRSLTDMAWKNATLHICHGGLGLPPTIKMCETAYVSSLVANAHLIQGLLAPRRFHLRPTIEPHIIELQRHLQLPPKLQTEALINRALEPLEREKLQAEFCQLTTAAELKTSTPQYPARSPNEIRDLTRLHSVSTTNASRVITTLPRSDIGTRVEPEIWRTIIDIRLGNPLYSGTTPCSRCATNGVSRILDRFGHHALVCAAAEGTIRRHNGLRDKIYSMIASPIFALNIVREWYFPQDLHLPREARRRMDLLIDDVSFAPKRQAYDVTVFSPHSSAYSKLTLDKAFAKAEQAKIRKYKALCDELSIDLHTIAFNVYGAISKTSEAPLQTIADFLAKKRGTSPVQERTQLLNVLTTWVNKTTAVAVNRRNLDSMTPS